MKLYGTIFFRTMFIIQHHVHKSSPADLLSCADQHWLTLLMSQLHFSAPPQHLVHVNQSSFEIPVLGMSPFITKLPIDEDKPEMQVAAQNGEERWGLFQGSHSAQGHSVAHSE